MSFTIVLRLSKPGSNRRRLGPRAWVAALIVAVALIVALVVVLTSGASSSKLPPLASPVGPEAIFTPGAVLKSDPASVLDEMRTLGVKRVRVFLPWNELAPDPTATSEPAGFDPADPAAYPATAWTIYDTIVREARARGLGVDFTLGPPPPLWASGKGAPQPSLHTYWRPNASDFGQFVRAVATRYSGRYVPPGASSPLPRVGFWSIWNEPNLGVQLAPQAIDHGTVEVSAELYRKLVDAAWSALHATGHGNDTILIGELAPAGVTSPGQPGNFDAMAPIRFVRALYCVGSNYKPLAGSAAAVRGCPTNAAGSARFADQNPALFHASAFADHPYPQGLPPNEATPDEPDFAELAEVPNLEVVLDRLQRVYGSDTKFPIYSTEFGYQTTPPDPGVGTVSPAVAAKYLNWSEYITWRNPRIRSYDQYLLVDSPNGNFASALKFVNGTPKPGFYAYRFPIWLPVTSTSRGSPLDVWGCLRPGHNVQLDTHRVQHAQIQFRPASGGAFKTVKTVSVTNVNGYFDVRTSFAGSGTVRLAWSYPHGPEIFSRAVAIALH